MKHLKKFKTYIKEYYSFQEGPQPGDNEYHSQAYNQEEEMSLGDYNDLLNSLKDGIPDIKDAYPRWICDRLENDSLIEEDDNFNWILTEDGKTKFVDGLSIKNYIETENAPSNDETFSEQPYLRGNEF